MEQDSKSLLQKLERESYRFDFFQAVRLLRRLSRVDEPDRGGRLARPIGVDAQPNEELVRFRSLPSHRFPQGEIASFRSSRLETSGRPRPPEMEVSFLGLTGPSGVLPRHYTQLVIDRTRHRDFALRDFLDLFHHRLISLYYRAWAKHRLPIAYESFRLGDGVGRDDVFTSALYCLVGHGTSGTRDRLEIPDETFLYFGGHFAHQPRNSVSLEALLGEFFQLPVQVCQFAGQWLYLHAGDQSRLSGDEFQRANNCLGSSVVVGQRVWGIENSFRVRVGPLTYSRFLDFTPGSPSLVQIGQLIRSYVGPGFDFQVQLILRHQEVPAAKLGGDAASRLGWNSWVFNRPYSEDVDDAVFDVDGEPIENAVGRAAQPAVHTTDSMHNPRAGGVAHRLGTLS